MKYSRKPLVSILLVLIVVFVIYRLYSASLEKERLILLTQIQTGISEYENMAKPYIDFSSITDFSWERMYIFNAYTDCDEIRKNIDVYWRGCQNTGIELYEGRSLFVFIKNGKVVQHVVVPGIRIDKQNNDGYSFIEAHFIINGYGYLSWVKEK